MKRIIKLISLIFFIVIIGLMFLNKTKIKTINVKKNGVYSGTQINENVYSVSNWQELKEVIENTENMNMEIILSAQTSNSWIANATITIPEWKIVNITSKDSINIVRNSFTGLFIQNNGILTIKTTDKNNKITFDGNKKNVEATDRIIVVGEAAILNLENVVLKNNKNTANKNSSGIAASKRSEITLNNVEILDNEALVGKYGGGIYTAGKLIINNSLISNNLSEHFGGGIYGISTSEIIVNDTTISKNSTHISGGGGIFSKGILKLNNAVISENTSGASGGGIYLFEGSVLEITGKNSKIKSNTASANGGGIFASGNMTLTDGEFLENSCATYGGAIYVNSTSETTMNNTKIYNNTKTTYGGGIFSKGILTIQDTDIYNNEATYGGGINSKGKLNIYDTKIHENKASKSGGGIYTYENSISEINGKNTKIYSNIAGTTGGGITTSGTIILIDGENYENHAGTKGGAIRLLQNGKIFMEGGIIENNFADQVETQGEHEFYFDDNTYFVINEKIKNNLNNYIKDNIDANLCIVDSNAPILNEPIYSTDKITDMGVTVTIESNEELRDIKGWRLSDDRKKITKIYRNNTDEIQNIEVYDLVGNKTNVDIKKIENVDNTLKNVIQECAYSYYMRGPKIQYNSDKGIPSYYLPEEATSQNTNYVVCSAFTKNVYKNLLEIKIPETTDELIEYARINKLNRPEVIAYGYKDKEFEDTKGAVDESGNQIGDSYDDILQITENELNQNRENFNSSIDDILMWFGDGKIKKNPSLDDIIPYLKVRRCNNIFGTCCNGLRFNL